MTLHDSARPAGAPLDVVRLRLRRRATIKALRASRIALLLINGETNEATRTEMELSVEQFRRARRWLRLAAAEARLTAEMLTVDEALRQYAERHVENVLRAGLLKDQGCSRQKIREQLSISDEEYDIADEWWRDAQVTG
jgi:hypothetical protein